MRYTIVTIAAFLFLAACSATPNQGMRVEIQDPCKAQCGSMFNSCTDDPAPDMARCNEDRAACEAQCEADDVTEEEGDGVITNE